MKSIQIERVSKSYTEDTLALDEVSLELSENSFTCLLGPSGSGKSTLLQALSGRSTPDKGSVLVNGQDLHAHFDALKQDIAVVPQKDVLHESLTVYQRTEKSYEVVEMLSQGETARLPPFDDIDFQLTPLFAFKQREGVPR